MTKIQTETEKLKKFMCVKEIKFIVKLPQRNPSHSPKIPLQNSPLNSTNNLRLRQYSVTTSSFRNREADGQFLGHDLMHNSDPQNLKSITNQNYRPNPHEHRHKTSLRTTTKHGSKLYPAIQV